ncbi:MAG: SDR family NAD(P)-dependent oxidoreductase [Chitinophagaceae bacterium]|nr:MAG: SDR family NAD(P)-dependent oxidoreductase [Chitinophagaceae bacterium]
MRNETYTLITGASEGFGKALALECARRKMNLILVALPGSGLNHLTCYIERNFDVKVLFFEHDLAKKEECYHLYEEINDRGLAMNVLINNAGMGGSHFFEDRDTGYYHRQIELNVVAPTILTHLFLDTLKKNQPSHILYVGSLAGFFYLPGKQVYGGTKSYLFAFSKSLRKELLSKKVYVSIICPGGMNTNLALTVMNRHQKGFNRWCLMKPEEVAAIAIRKMLQKKEVIIPGKWNRFFMLLDKLIPTRIKELITNLAMKQHSDYKSPVSPIIHPLKKAI